MLGVAPHTTAKAARFNTALGPAIPEADMSETQLEIKQISNKWATVRLLSREEAEATLDEKWLDAYNRFFEKYDDDMTRMVDYVERIIKSIEPPKIQKKSLGQVRRDRWAKVQAREAYRAAANQKHV
jgi:predicted house-cleaning noncanonical NTP pyrophosphatase (MazG superfamily)